MNRKQKALLTVTALTIIVLVVATSTLFATTPTTNKLQVVATLYPLAFLSQEIGGEHVQITQLIPNNMEIHSWEPSASHISSAEKSDIILYNGAGLDHWVETEILPALSNTKNRAVVDTTNGLPLLSGDSHKHDEEANNSEEHHEHASYDPHTWVSLYMAKLQAEKIYTAFIQTDPDHESYYTERWLSLKERFEQLDGNYTEELSTKQKDTIFVSHEAFSYLAYRYGFEQHGVIGLSADEQPSPTAIAGIVDLMTEYETFVVYVDPVYSEEYAQTLKNELQTQTGNAVIIQKLYLMLGPIDGKDYFQQQLFNLDSLKLGLAAS